MPSLSDYFAQVLIMEEQLKTNLKARLPQALVVQEWIDNPDAEAQQLFDLVMGVIAQPYQQIEELGYDFAESINGGKPVVREVGAAVEAAMGQAGNDVFMAINQFLLEFENTANRMLDAGMEPERVAAALQAGLAGTPSRMWAALINGVANAAAVNVKLAAETARTQSLLATEGQPNAGDREWVWVTVEDSRVCTDCRPRHNQIESMTTWDQLGKPGTGWSVCDDWCRCMVMPSEWAAENIPDGQPIKLDRAAVTAIGQRAKELAGG